MGIMQLVLLLLSAWGAADAANPYDYLQFVQQWPATFCSGRSDCIPNPPQNYFTIHGLWPSNYSTPGQDCHGTPFSGAEMSATENHGLRYYFLPVAWPQLIAHYSDMDFWETEYTRHGTCSEDNLNQTEYFKKAYWMWYQYNAYQLFAIAPSPIYPGNYYYRIDLENAIQRVTVYQPVLRCRQIRVGRIDVWYLEEVIICFDDMGNNSVPCGRRTNCGVIIYYGY